jgi:hypothetical protein
MWEENGIVNRLGVQGDALQGVGYEEKGDIIMV